MSASRTITTTSNNSSTTGPSRSRPVPPTPADPSVHEEESLEDILRRAQERVQKVRARKAAEAARKAAEEKAARAAAAREKAVQEARERALRARQQEEEIYGSMEIRREKGKGKGKAKAQPVDEDPDDDDNEDDRAPCERCRAKKISCQMQAGKRSSIICKPCHKAKVKCSYSGRPSIVKKEVSANPTGEHLAVLESQVAQLLADNRQLRDGQVKANTYHRHFNRKLDWLITDAARRRKSPPEMTEAGPSGVLRKRRRVVDSDEEEERGIEEDGEGEVEEEGKGMEAEEEGEGKSPASEKGKEREVE
ncbi:hypothetical protein EV359DRAFT_87435 [Lentinula novae-zelandiae]|nr:hypothetical protein EV359DRAFT_87435 [Lentinula novae-zelandiae]